MARFTGLPVPASWRSVGLWVAALPARPESRLGYDLPANHVVHTVGPVYRDGASGESELLASAYRSSLELAQQHGLKSVAFPSISTGAYRYPIEQASRIALETSRAWMRKHRLPEKVVFVLFSQQDLAVYEESLTRILE